MSDGQKDTKAYEKDRKDAEIDVLRTEFICAALGGICARTTSPTAVAEQAISVADEVLKRL